MSKKRIEDGLDYRQYQKRNSTAFAELMREQQKQLRADGYRNVGWENAIASWELLQPFVAEAKPPTTPDPVALEFATVAATRQADPVSGNLQDYFEERIADEERAIASLEAVEDRIERARAEMSEQTRQAIERLRQI